MRFRWPLVCLVLLLTLGPALAATPALQVGQAVRVTIAGGQVQRWVIHAADRQFVRVVVDQQGIDVVVTLRDAAGHVLNAFNTPDLTSVRETVSVVTGGAGDLQVEIAPREEHAATGPCVLCLEVLRPALPGDADSVAAERAFMGGQELYYKGGSASNKRMAIELIRVAQRLFQRLGDVARRGASWNLIGIIQQSLGETDPSMRSLETARALRHRAGEAAGEAQTVCNLASVYAGAPGRSAQAQALFEESVALARSSHDLQQTAHSLMCEGQFFDFLGDSRRAIRCYEEAAPLYHRLGSPGWEGTLLCYTAAAYARLGDEEESVSAYMKVLDLPMTGRYRAILIEALRSLSTTLASQGKYPEAIKYLNIAHRAAAGMGEISLQAEILSDLGIVYFVHGEAPRSLSCLRRGLVLAHRVGYPDFEAGILGQLMYVHKQLKQAPLAILYGKLAIKLIQSLRVDVAGLDRRLQHSFLKAREDTYRMLADVLVGAGRLPEAEQVLDMLKRDEYFEFVRGVGGGARGSAELTPREREAEKTYRRIADQVTAMGREYSELLALDTRTPAQEERLKALEADITTANDAFQKFMDGLADTYAKAGHSDEAITDVREVQGLQADLWELGEGVVALRTIILPDKYCVILVTPTTTVAREYKIGSAELNRKITLLRQALKQPSLDPRPQAQELYKIMVGPVARDLQGARATTLMWSLDGSLRYLPVGALYDGQQYLVERYRSVIFTPASNARLKDRPQASWIGLGLGVSKPHEGFKALPGVPLELKEIIRPGPLDGTIVLDETFTRQAMSDYLRRHKFSVVHIASHFSFKPGNDGDSYLLLGDGSHLTLADVKRLPSIFSGVDLLTLSACDTGMGGAGADGKEVEGFGVLAQRQGAKAVMASLWPVADESTALLMKRFYAIRQKDPTRPKADALRQAQLEFVRGTTPPGAMEQIHGTRGSADVEDPPEGLTPYPADPRRPFGHPYYWAPFILIGNWK